MRAAPDTQLLLLDVQERDTAIAQAEHRRKTLPEHAQLVAGQKTRRGLSEAIVAVETQVGDLEKDLAKAEADLVPVRERKARNQKRVDDGAADPKALQAMIDEIAHLGNRISDLEDVQLDVMERLEAAQQKLDDLIAQRSSLEGDLRKLIASRDEQVAVIAAEIAAEEAKRAEFAAGVPADLLALYDKIRARSGGVGAARLKGRRCEGCQLEATASAMEQYLAAAADDVIRCEECDRILVRGA
jgi:predicted  nucleic acid-binding Zn-ribbon protein